ncbi:MAG: prepilin-type N-terminal cleavage/methylation domain-containing protein [Gemmatimonadaceae bacterium]
MPTSARAYRPRRRRRDGMTIVEVLVALMIVSIGLLGIAGSTALALRTAHESVQRRNAMHRMVSRQSQLAAAGCSAASSGAATDSAHGIVEAWYVSVQTSGFALVRDSVRWMGPRGPRSFVLESAFPC